MDAVPVSASRAGFVRRHSWPIALFLLAFGLRLALVLTSRDLALLRAPIGDALKYEELAERILGGDLGAGDQTFFHSASGYPYLLACLWAVTGKSILVARLVQCLAGALNVVVIWALTRRLFDDASPAGAHRGRVVAALAGLLAAGYGYLAFEELILFMTAYEILAIDLGLLALLAFLDGRRWRHLVGAGLCFGFASLGRPNAWLLAVVLGAFVFLALARAPGWNLRRRLAALATLVGLTFLVILPVTVRNARVAHDRVLLTANAGINFYIGNNPNADGTFVIPPSMDTDLFAASCRQARHDTGRDLTPGEVSSYWFGLTLRAMTQDPLGALRRLGRKALLLLDAYEIPNNVDFYFLRERGAWFLYLMPIGFWLVAPLGLVGVLTFRPRALRQQLVLLALGLYFAMIAGLFVTGRYRLPMVPMLIPFAAWSLQRLLDDLRHARLGALGRSAALLVPAFVLVDAGFMARQHPYGPWRSDQWAFQAWACERLGDAAGSQAAWEESRRLDPENPAPYANLGDAARQRGDLNAAEPLLRRAWELSRGDPDMAASLAGVLSRLGRSDEAVRILEQALATDPDNLYCLTNLAAAHYAARQPAQALVPAQRLVALGKALPQTFNLIARAQSETGALAAALESAEEGTRRFPEDQELWVTRAELELARNAPEAARRAYQRAVALPGASRRLTELGARLGADARR